MPNKHLHYNPMYSCIVLTEINSTLNVKRFIIVIFFIKLILLWFRVLKIVLTKSSTIVFCFHRFLNIVEMSGCLKQLQCIHQCCHTCSFTLYSSEFECSCVERLHSLSLHCDVSLLQALFLQQIIYLQKMLSKVLGQQLALRGTKGWRKTGNMAL